MAITGNPIVFRRFNMSASTERFIRETVCDSHGGNFSRWAAMTINAGPYPTLTDDDFNRWLASVLRRLAKLKARGYGVHRCEIVTKDRSGAPPGTRCAQFATRIWRNHHVCGIHGAILNRASESLYDFNTTRTVTTKLLAKLVGELLA